MLIIQIWCTEVTLRFEPMTSSLILITQIPHLLFNPSGLFLHVYGSPISKVCIVDKKKGSGYVRWALVYYSHLELLQLAMIDKRKQDNESSPLVRGNKIQVPFFSNSIHSIVFIRDIIFLNTFFFITIIFLNTGSRCKATSALCKSQKGKVPCKDSHVKKPPSLDGGRCHRCLESGALLLCWVLFIMSLE